jgi:hypothetical protein
VYDCVASRYREPKECGGRTRSHTGRRPLTNAYQPFTMTREAAGQLQLRPFAALATCGPVIDSRAGGQHRRLGPDAMVIRRENSAALFASMCERI